MTIAIGVLVFAVLISIAVYGYLTETKREFGPKRSAVPAAPTAPAAPEPH